MKNFLRDGSQIILAILITTSFIVANAASVSSPVPKQPIKHTVAVESKTIAPVAPQTVQEPAPAPETIVDPTPAPTPVVAAPVAPQPTYTGSHEDWMAQAGIDPVNYWAVDYIVSRESSWNPCAYYPSHSNCGLTAADVGNGACGLGMSLPCGKWGANWTDPINQLVNMNIYVGKYGGWPGAVAHWKAYQSY